MERNYSLAEILAIEKNVLLDTNAFSLERPNIGDKIFEWTPETIDQDAVEAESEHLNTIESGLLSGTVITIPQMLHEFFRYHTMMYRGYKKLLTQLPRNKNKKLPQPVKKLKQFVKDTHHTHQLMEEQCFGLDEHSYEILHEMNTKLFDAFVCRQSTRDREQHEQKIDGSKADYHLYTALEYSSMNGKSVALVTKDRDLLRMARYQPLRIAVNDFSPHNTSLVKGYLQTPFRIYFGNYFETDAYQLEVDSSTLPYQTTFSKLDIQNNTNLCKRIIPKTLKRLRKQ